MINKKIICFTDSFNSGGAQKQMVMLVNGLDKDHEVQTLQYHDLIFFSKSINQNIKQGKILEKNTILRVLKLLLYFNKEKPDVIIAFLTGPNNYAALYKMLFFWRKITLVVGERNLNIAVLNYKDFLTRFSHLFADYIVCNSNAQREKLKAYFKRKLRFIPNGTNIGDINYKIFSDSKPSSYKLIVAGRFTQQKNPLGLIKAIKNLQNISVYWYGEIYNDNLIYTDCINYLEMNKMKNFHFMETTTDIYKEMLLYDALILPSFYEGCPNAIIDAMFCGLPVLASNVSDNSIYLEHQKELIFDPFNTKDISDKILKFISLDPDRLQCISNVNRIKAIEFFDSETMINNYLKLII
jgi:glycosyltransferase involved in cell wall biosynthesis